MPINLLRLRRNWLTPLMLVTNCLLAGCGGSERPELGLVTGIVTFDGQPLASAAIVFAPEEGKGSRAFTDEQGRYELIYLREVKGAVVGPHTVQITTATERNPVEKLPPRYHIQSELRVETRSGSNTLNFELKP